MQITLGTLKPIGRFEYSWPDALEEFGRGWDVDAVIDGHTRCRVRHGIGRRVAYGRSRIHTVTFVDGQPRVEGVEADDYTRTRSLLSRVKRPDNKTARTVEEIPPGVERFPIVDHRSEIDAPYSPRCLAVKIAEDDIISWARFALLRTRLFGRI